MALRYMIDSDTLSYVMKGRDLGLRKRFSDVRIQRTSLCSSAKRMMKMKSDSTDLSSVIMLFCYNIKASCI